MNKHAVLELIMGIVLLAVVVLAMIIQLNPLERARERRDERLRADSTALITAIENFYKDEGRLPWSDDFGGNEITPGLPWVTVRKAEVGVCSEESCRKAGELVTTNKLDPAFFSGSSVNAPLEDTLYVGKGKGANDKVFVCFLPDSEKERTNFEDLYSIDFEFGITSRGAPLKCLSEVSWKEGDVCHTCL